MKSPEYTNLYRNKVDLSFGGKVGVTARGTGFLLGMMKMF